MENALKILTDDLKYILGKEFPNDSKTFLFIDLSIGPGDYINIHNIVIEYNYYHYGVMDIVKLQDYKNLFVCGYIYSFKNNHYDKRLYSITYQPPLAVTLPAKQTIMLQQGWIRLMLLSNNY